MACAAAVSGLGWMPRLVSMRHKAEAKSPTPAMRMKPARRKQHLPRRLPASPFDKREQDGAGPGNMNQIDDEVSNNPGE